MTDKPKDYKFVIIGDRTWSIGMTYDDTYERFRAADKRGNFYCFMWIGSDLPTFFSIEDGTIRWDGTDERPMYIQDTHKPPTKTIGRIL